MDRNRRFEIMAQAQGQAGTELLLLLAEAVLAEGSLVVVTPPRVGMLMLRLREPVDGEVFNAGEVLVTEAQVALDRHQGYAMRLGRQPEVTLAAAVLDAAVEAGHDLAPRILDGLAALEAADRDRRAAAWQQVAPTRVTFDELH